MTNAEAPPPKKESSQPNHGNSGEETVQTSAKPQATILNNDSKTFDVKVLGGRRQRITVRIKPEIKEALNQFCSKNGLSICHIFELLVTGYLTGVKQKIDFDAKSPTINLSVVREIKRIRRYANESNDHLLIEDAGSATKCAYSCNEPVIAKHFVYTDKEHCTTTFVCRRHHEELKKRSTGWSNLRSENI